MPGRDLRRRGQKGKRNRLMEGVSQGAAEVGSLAALDPCRCMPLTPIRKLNGPVANLPDATVMRIEFQLQGSSRGLTSHGCLKPEVTQALMRRFASSHQIQCIEDNGQPGVTRLPPYFIKI
jgi:hypothetical protein